MQKTVAKRAVAKKFLLLLLIAFPVWGQNIPGQDGLHETPLSNTDRGPWGGTGLVVDATRCAEFTHILSDAGSPFHLTKRIYEALSGRPYIPQDSTATYSMVQQRFNLSFDLENTGTTLSNTFLAQLYRDIGKVQWRAGRYEGHSQYAIRNFRADAGAKLSDPVKSRIEREVDEILAGREDFSLE